MTVADQLKARVLVKKPGVWTNKHGTISQRIDRLYAVSNPPHPATGGWADLRLTVRMLQMLLAEAGRDCTRLRAIGGGWSLSEAAATDGRLVNTKALNWRFPLSNKYLSLDHQSARPGFCFVQCGTSIGELNTHLARQGRSLKTSGASNGPTIVGAMSTGTHGAALDIGAVQDSVVGLHIILSPQRHVWLERKSDPIVSDELLDKLGAVSVRDDLLFESALVSFGSFGLIHAVLIETEPAYLLECYRFRIPLDDNLRTAMDNLDFSSLQLPQPKERPFHFEIVVNPHDTRNGVYITVMYKRPFREQAHSTVDGSEGFGPGADVLSIVGMMTDEFPKLTPFMVNGLASKLFTDRSDVCGTPNDVFSSSHVYGTSMSTEIAVSVENASRALNSILTAHATHGPFGGFVVIRYVKRSPAILAFTKFDMSCTIELPGVGSDRSATFYRDVWDELDHDGIPYTLHWGQVNNFTPDKVHTMYGEDMNRWVESREKLLDPAERNVFSSPFLEKCGLAG